MQVKNEMPWNEYLSTGSRETCYGCGACEHVCPARAIVMKSDGKGFFYPTLDKRKCIQCGKCRDICIYHRPDRKNTHDLYALQNKSENVLEYCQSGGAFDAFSEFILNDGGKVWGAVISDDLSVRHVGADSRSTRNQMRGSKYTKSDFPEDQITCLEKDISSGRKVLFTGTPCQCAMVSSLFGHCKNLITMEFICHGTPSPVLWKDYVAWFEKKMFIKVRDAFFRVQLWKNKGLHTVLLKSANGNDYFNSDYSALFYSHFGHREACFSCKYANKNRQADITVGDFWDKSLYKGFNNKYNVSMCIINTDKGRNLFDKIQNNVRAEKVSYEQDFKQQPCLYEPIARPKDYDVFWDVYESEKFENVIQFIPKAIYNKYHLFDGGGVMRVSQIADIRHKQVEVPILSKSDLEQLRDEISIYDKTAYHGMFKGYVIDYFIAAECSGV